VSGIFGLFQRDGRPVEPAHLQAMLEGMRSWGPHGASIWQSDVVGLGQLLLHNTPESQFEKLPFVEENGGLAITSTSRLDNRGELCNRLNIPPEQRAILPDSALLLESYKKWGQDCPKYLIGDWCFAVWDKNKGRLFIARDTNGISGLYYHAAPHFFCFASSLAGLLALPQVPRQLDENLLARSLASLPNNSEHEVHTLYQGIRHLGAAHALTVTATNVELNEYWRIQDSPVIHFKSDAEYLEAFHEIFQKAVEARMRSSKGAALALSSGLDSIAVAAFAARKREITAYTAIPAHAKPPKNNLGRYHNEWDLAHQAASAIGNIHHIPLNSEHVSPVQSMQTMLLLYRQPMNNAGNLYWLMDMLEQTRQAGLGTLLTGQRGNASISWTGNQKFDIWPFILSGDWRNGWGEMQKWHKAQNSSWANTLKIALLRSLVKSTQSRLFLSLPGQTPWKNYASINPNFAREHNLWQQMQAEQFHPSLAGNLPLEERHLGVYQVGRRTGGSLWAELAAAHQIEVSDPTADQRVLEFCFGIPNEQYTRNGQDRLLIRRTLAGRCPPEIVWNKRRGLQAADIGLRLVEDAVRMDDLLAALTASPQAVRILDLPKMKRRWASLKTAPLQNTSYKHSAELLKMGMVGLFLMQFDSKT